LLFSLPLSVGFVYTKFSAGPVQQRNQVERQFRRLKRFRRIFTRYDKLDIIFLSFVYFAFIVDALV